MNDFQGIIGATYRYTGVNNGLNGTLEYKFFSAPQLGDGGMKSTITFYANDPSSNYTINMYAVNTAIQTAEYANATTSYTMFYDPAWSLAPRFVKIGNSYNSTGNYSYTVNGIFVTGTVDSQIQIIGTEHITTPVGTFEAIKAQATLTLTDSWYAGWIQVNQSQSVWYVRGVGMVKQIISAQNFSSSGENYMTNTNLSISFSSDPLPNIPVTPSTTWGKYQKQNGDFVDTEDWLGWLEVSKAPWVFSYNENHYLYIPPETANSGSGWIYTP